LDNKRLDIVKMHSVTVKICYSDLCGLVKFLNNENQTTTKFGSTLIKQHLTSCKVLWCIGHRKGGWKWNLSFWL